MLTAPALADSLLHYNFDSDFMDSSGNNNNGSASGNAVITNAAGNFIIGSGAVALDGTGDFVTATGFKGVTGTNPRTVSAWVRSSPSTSDQSIVSWGSNVAGQKWTFRQQDTNGTAGALRTEVNGGYVVGDTPLDDDLWHHVAATFSDDGTPDVLDVKLYVDGVLQTNSATSAQALNTASGNDVRVGQDFTNRFWDGLIDDVGIFDESLSDGKVAAINSLGRVLNYDLGNDEDLFDLFDAADPGVILDIDGVPWRFVGSGLSGPLGQVQTVNGGLSLLLDATAGSGVAQAIPEPASLALWLLLGATLGVAGHLRRKRGERGT